jgi:hypothetical protein
MENPTLEEVFYFSTLKHFALLNNENSHSDIFYFLLKVMYLRKQIPSYQDFLMMVNPV